MFDPNSLDLDLEFGLPRQPTRTPAPCIRTAWLLAVAAVLIFIGLCALIGWLS